jgi:hypothetical protein
VKYLFEISPENKMVLTGYQTFGFVPKSSSVDPQVESLFFPGTLSSNDRFHGIDETDEE